MLTGHRQSPDGFGTRDIMACSRLISVRLAGRSVKTFRPSRLRASGCLGELEQLDARSNHQVLKAAASDPRVRVFSCSPVAKCRCAPMKGGPELAAAKFALGTGTTIIFHVRRQLPERLHRKRVQVNQDPPPAGDGWRMTRQWQAGNILNPPPPTPNDPKRKQNVSCCSLILACAVQSVLRFELNLLQDSLALGFASLLLQRRKWPRRAFTRS